MYANGRILPDSSLYVLVTGQHRRPKLARRADGKWPYIIVD